MPQSQVQQQQVIPLFGGTSKNVSQSVTTGDALTGLGTPSTGNVSEMVITVLKSISLVPAGFSFTGLPNLPVVTSLPSSNPSSSFVTDVGPVVLPTNVQDLGNAPSPSVFISSNLPPNLVSFNNNPPSFLSIQGNLPDNLYQFNLNPSSFISGLLPSGINTIVSNPVTFITNNLPSNLASFNTDPTKFITNTLQLNSITSSIYGMKNVLSQQVSTLRDAFLINNCFSNGAIPSFLNPSSQDFIMNQIVAQVQYNLQDLITTYNNLITEIGSPAIGAGGPRTNIDLIAGCPKDFVRLLFKEVMYRISLPITAMFQMIGRIVGRFNYTMQSIVSQITGVAGVSALNSPIAGFNAAFMNVKVPVWNWSHQTNFGTGGFGCADSDEVYFSMQTVGLSNSGFGFNELVGSGSIGAKSCNMASPLSLLESAMSQLNFNNQSIKTILNNFNTNISSIFNTLNGITGSVSGTTPTFIGIGGTSLPVNVSPRGPIQS